MLDNNYLFNNVGIDSIGFYVPRYYVNLEELLVKFRLGFPKHRTRFLYREKRLPEVDEDVISMGLKAGYSALLRGNISAKKIDAVFVGTETITYAVKSVSNIFAELLDIPPNSMTQDVYNTSIGGTLAILNAIALIEKDIIKKALVICADLPIYNIHNLYTLNQGAGAIAFIISKNPRIATFSKGFGKVSGNIDDFHNFRIKHNENIIDQYSVDTYLNFQLRAYDNLIKNIGDFHADFYTFHAPFLNLPIKCMENIILKRWTNHIRNLSKFKRNKIRTSILKKFDYFLHDVTVLPQYIYLKLKERGFSSYILEDISHWFIFNFKGRILPQLRIPSHFGNMHNASIWAQIIYILENFAKRDHTIYFGSYGSGASCISGLLKVQDRFKTVINKGPNMDYFIKNKKYQAIERNKLMKKRNINQHHLLGRVVEHKLNNNRGFTLYFCDKGCIIPNITGLNHCPKGHSGYNKQFFPLFAILKTTPIINSDFNDLSFMKKGLVRIAWNTKKESLLELEMRRVDYNNEEKIKNFGLLNWNPLYVPIHVIY